MQRSRGIVVGVVSVCLAASMSAPAQGADSTPHFERILDRRGDVRVARGDLIRATTQYRTRRLRLTATLRRAGSYKTRNWQYGDTFLLWYLDTNSDSDYEHAAVVFNNGRDRLRAIIVDRFGERRCRAGVRKRRNTFRVSAPHRCIGSPRYVRFHTVMVYDRNVADRSERSLTIDRAPNRRRWSRVVRRPPQPVKITITRPETRALNVRYGSDAVIRSDITWVYGEALSLWRRYHGSTRWERVAVGSEPQWSQGVGFSFEPRRSADYQVRYAGSKWHAASRSRIVPVYPRMDVTHDHRSWPTQRPRGHVMDVGGRVRPPNPGGTVWLQRRTSKGWVSEASARVTDENSFQLRKTLTASGEFVFRVLASGTGAVKPGGSATFQVSVYSARITKVEPSDAASEATDLNSEYVSVLNDGRVPVDLYRWLVDANLLQTATIPHGHTLLDPGDGVRIHTGSGQASPGHVYLGRPAPMWPPTGIARLFDDDGVLMSRYDY